MVTESGMTVSGNTVRINEAHRKRSAPHNEAANGNSVDQERVETKVGSKYSWSEGRVLERKSWGLGPEGMGKIRGICRQHMPACTV